MEKGSDSRTTKPMHLTYRIFFTLPSGSLKRVADVRAKDCSKALREFKKLWPAATVLSVERFYGPRKMQ